METLWFMRSLSSEFRDFSVPSAGFQRTPPRWVHDEPGEEVLTMTKMSVRKPGAIRLTVRCAYYCPCCG